jgi:hypothetical protein
VCVEKGAGQGGVWLGEGPSQMSEGGLAQGGEDGAGHYLVRLGLFPGMGLGLRDSQQKCWH